MNTFFWYPKCSTCQKAKKFLEENNLTYQEREIQILPPTIEEIKYWLQTYEIELKKLWNTSGILYREKNLKEKLLFMSEDEKISLLASHGMLVRRPILVGNDFILVGFRENEWRDRLCKKS